MHRRIALLLASLCAPLASAAVPMPQQAVPSGGVPGALLRKMGRGANVTRWFCYQGGYDDAGHLANYLGAQDAANFRRLGITWVRLCLAPEAVYGEGGAPKAKTMPYVDRATEWFARQGMAVLLDLHDNGQLKLDAPGRKDEDFLAFWRAMALRYKGKGYDRIAFELVNEPVFGKNPGDWTRMQDRAVDAIRAADPKRTVMVSGTGWSGRDTMLAMKPLPRTNLLYTFHCYEPFWFTHQGATWAGDAVKTMSGVPFPSSPEAVEPVALRTPKPYDDYLRDYGRQRWDTAKLREWLGAASAWGRANRVPVVLGEFGAYPPVSPPDSRERWYAAFRAAVRESGLPNAIWGYDDGFGLGRSVAGDGTVRLDPMVQRVFYGSGGR